MSLKKQVSLKEQMSLKKRKYSKETKGDKGNMRYGHTHCVLLRLYKITIDYPYMKKIRTLFFNKSSDFIFAPKAPKHKAVRFSELLTLSFCGIILCGFFGEVRKFQCNRKGDD